MIVLQVRGKIMLNELIFLRFIAILLITNSHFDHFYPIPELSTGGSLGNSIFFIISAMGLTMSLNRHKVDFRNWITKRFFRIYPLVWIVTSFLLLIGFLQVNNAYDLYLYYIWPTPFWFFSAIMFLYFPIYFIINRYSTVNVLWIFIFATSFYGIWYVTMIDLKAFSIEVGFFKILFYFIIMIFGVFIANNYNLIKNKKSYDGILFLAITFVYFGLKLVIMKLSLYQIQFFVHIITIPWLFYLLKTISNSKLIMAVMDKRILSLCITVIAASSMEIYLVQGYIRSIGFVNSAIFPINIVIFTIVTIPTAYLLHYSYEKIIAYLTGIKYKL